MKKLLFSIMLVPICAFAQTGYVGINTASPQGTLDVRGVPSDNTKLDGIIAPRLTGQELGAKNYGGQQIGSLVYVTAPSPSLVGQVINVDEPGYYYYDGTVWVKILFSNAKSTFSVNMTYNDDDQDGAFGAFQFNVQPNVNALPTTKYQYKIDRLAGSLNIQDDTEGIINKFGVWRDLPPSFSNWFDVIKYGSGLFSLKISIKNSLGEVQEKKLDFYRNPLAQNYVLSPMGGNYNVNQVVTFNLAELFGRSDGEPRPSLDLFQMKYFSDGNGEVKDRGGNIIAPGELQPIPNKVFSYTPKSTGKHIITFNIFPDDYSQISMLTYSVVLNVN